MRSENIRETVISKLSPVTLLLFFCNFIIYLLEGVCLHVHIFKQLLYFRASCAEEVFDRPTIMNG